MFFYQSLWFFFVFGEKRQLILSNFISKWYFFSFSLGVTPCISTIDPEMIKEITVKQFDNFTDIIDIDFAPGQTTLDLSK